MFIVLDDVLKESLIQVLLFWPDRGVHVETTLDAYITVRLLLLPSVARVDSRSS